MTVQIELGNPQGVLLAEIKERAMKREDVALTYAMAMLSSEVVDWPTVNHAILDRWSMAGLKWIKTRAWRLVEERKAASPEDHS